MSKGKPGEGMKALNARMNKPHPCEGCGEEIPPSSLRFCARCRTLLVRVLT